MARNRAALLAMRTILIRLTGILMAMTCWTPVDAAIVVRCDYTVTRSIYKNGALESETPGLASWRIYRVTDTSWDSLSPGDTDWKSIDCKDRCTITANTLTDNWDFRQESPVFDATLYQRVYGSMTIGRIDGSYRYRNVTDTYRTGFADGTQWVRNGTSVRRWNGSANDGAFNLNYGVEERVGKCAPTTDPLASRPKIF